VEALIVSRRVAIIQSSYIPWRGYFAIIASCDVFIFLDSVQFTRRDWRTRNSIKTPSGASWLTVPVKQKGNYHASIDTIEIADPDWSKQHLRKIEAAYRRANNFAGAFPILSAAFAAAADEISLSAMNQGLTRMICNLLGISTPMLRDVDLLPRDDLQAMDPTKRLLNLAKAVDATEYLSGPSARNYLDETLFLEAGLTVFWMDYAVCLVPYAQLWNDFEPAVSIVDPILNLGFAGTRDTLS
jgi:hypothetical protein